MSAPRGHHAGSRLQAVAHSRSLHRVCMPDRASSLTSLAWRSSARERDLRSQPSTMYHPDAGVPTRRWNVSWPPEPYVLCGAMRMKEGSYLRVRGILAECKCQFARGDGGSVAISAAATGEWDLRIRTLGDFALAQANRPASSGLGMSSWEGWRAQEHAQQTGNTTTVIKFP
jgi:hypothetical protein